MRGVKSNVLCWPGCVGLPGLRTVKCAGVSELVSEDAQECSPLTSNINCYLPSNNRIAIKILINTH